VWEHTFLTSEGHPSPCSSVPSRTETCGWRRQGPRHASRPPRDALKLVYLYAEKESPKYERAALKFLRRYLDEKEPTLKNFAKVVRGLERRQIDE